MRLTFVLPSIPGYGFSSEPTSVGWDPGRVARAWAELMQRLGYTRYVAHGGDVGALHHRRDGPPGTCGVGQHPYQLARDWAGGRRASADTEEERAAIAALATVPRERLWLLPGAGHTAADDRLRSAGFTVALAAWMLDHDTDSYEKISRAFVEGQPSGGLTRDHILDNITLYWLTGTGASAARSYWESGRAERLRPARLLHKSRFPVGFTTFPGEIFRAPRSWVEKSYPNLIYYHEAARGGHFAAWEEPQLFSEEIRAGFRALR